MAILRSDTTIGGRNILDELDNRLPLTGGTLTGNLRLKKSSSNYGCKINFGDGEYVYLEEKTDDHLTIHGSNITLDSSNPIHGVKAPAVKTDVANKAYVDDGWFGACTESTTSRTVTVAKDFGGTFTLSEYMTIKVNFTQQITSGTTLNVNGTGAYTIQVINSSGGHVSPSSTYPVIPGIHTLLYENGFWIVLGFSDYAYTITSTLPTSKGGTGLTSTTNSSYTSTYFRAGTFNTSAPTSLSNGTFSMVYA